ncbi:MAG: outer membrane protein assembly factor BamD [Hydrogenophilus sp.]|nr:outer membrane protein assembly factor BamD [Hydrogenophilus sp.]
MKRWIIVGATVWAAGCSLLAEKGDETRSWSAQKLYSEARAALEEGAYARAAELLEKLEARFPFGRFAQQAQMELAYSHYKQGESELALAAVERFIRLYPDHPHLDYMYYLRGLIFFNEERGLLAALGNQDLSERDPKGARDALAAFMELLRRFPESPYAEDAAARALYLRHALARHELHVARYYLKRGAFVAAANRAKRVLQEFDDTPAVEGALHVLAEAYRNLGLSDLQADVERVLQQNFPAQAKREERKRAWWQFW